MHNFNRIRKALEGFKFPSYGEGELAWTGLNSLAFFGLTGNTNMTGSNDAVSNNDVPTTINSFTTPVAFNPEELKKRERQHKQIRNWKTFTNKTGLNVLANSIKNGGIGYDLLLNGMTTANAYMNKDLVNSEGFNTVNGMLDTASNVVGKFNPTLGLAIKGFQTGVNLINKGTSKQTDLFSINQETRSNLGGSYAGSYTNMANTEDKAGLEYGGFNRKAYKEAQNEIAEGIRMDGLLQNINEDNQNRLAMAANIFANTLRYATDLDGGLDARYLRAAKLGIKLEHLGRIKHLKIKLIVNVDTKLIEEFKEGGKIEEFVPTITDPIEQFKEGGIIEEFVPVITEPVEEFKEGGKTKENELVNLEETTLKNVIPEGALHKNKHHIENTERLTLKGIPVIDNDGELQAEIELNEIIFTLEVTKKLEELHKLYKEGSNKERDEAAIEAGRLLVQEILYNTDDRTGLIAKCEKGGKL